MHNIIQYGFSGVPVTLFYFNFNNLKYSVCKLYILLCSFHTAYVCSLHPAETLIIKHVSSMVTTSKTAKERKSLSVYVKN